MNYTPKNQFGHKKRKIDENDQSNDPQTQQSGQSDGSQSMDSQSQAYLFKFGNLKAHVLDSWLEKSNSELIQECIKFQIKPSGKHIENMQKLFDYYKEFEKNEEENIQQVLKQMQISQKQEFKLLPTKTGPKSTQKVNHQSTQSSDFKKQTKYSLDIFNEEDTSKNEKEFEITKSNYLQELEKVFKHKKQYSLFKPEEVDQAQNQDHQYKELEGAAQTQFEFSKQFLDKALTERKDIISDLEHTNQIFSSQKFNNQELFQFKITSQFEGQDNFIKLMDLKENEFDDLSNLMKKKTNLNIQAILGNISPNTLNLFFPEIMHSEGIVSLLIKNWDIISQVNKQMFIKERFQVEKSFQTVNSALLKENPQRFQNLFELQIKINDKERIVPFLKLVEKSFYDKFGIQSDQSKTDVLNHANIINLLLKNAKQYEYQVDDIKIKNSYFQYLKKHLARVDLTELTLQELVSMLGALPKYEGPLSSVNSTPQYLILNQLLSQQGDYQFRFLSQDQVFLLIEKVIELQDYKCRDILHRLKGKLYNIQTQNFCIQDYLKMFELLQKVNSESTNNVLDSKLILTMILRRSLKMLTVPKYNSDFEILIKFYEKLFQENSLAFTVIATSEIKQIIIKFHNYMEKIETKLEHQVRLAVIFNSSMYFPTFGFEQMINKKDESFRDHVDPLYLKSLISEINKRSSEGQVSFEHLNISASRMHKLFVPYNVQTLILLRRILSDFFKDENQGKLSLLQNNAINKIFQSESIILKMFSVQSEAIEIIKKVLTDQELQFQNLDNFSELNYDEKIEYFYDLFSCFENFQTLSNFSEESQEIRARISLILDQAIKHLNEMLKEYEDYKMTDFFKLNSAALSILSHYPNLKEYYINNSLILEIVNETLGVKFLMQKPHLTKFGSMKKNISVANQVQEQAHTTINQCTVEILNTLLLTSSTNDKEIALKFCQRMENGRILDQNNLVSLFRIFEKFSLLEKAKPLLINLIPNLTTINQKKFYEAKIGKKQKFIRIKDENFLKEQKRREEEDLKIKEMIFKQYLQIWNSSPEVFMQQQLQPQKDKPTTEKTIALAPLSKIMADLFDSFSDQQMIVTIFIYFDGFQTCLKLLRGQYKDSQDDSIGSAQVDNYHEDFIQKLYDRYSQDEIVCGVFNNSNKFFIELAKYWPNFLKNHTIFSKLINQAAINGIVSEQGEILSILTKKNILYPELIEAHFNTVAKMKDKDIVAKYMKEIIHSCAYLGYTQIDIPKLVQIMRRIYKEPANIEDINQILDLLMLLALSSRSYKDFDDKKNVEFVNECIEIIEKQFSGTKTLSYKFKDPVTLEEEETTLTYYDSIEGENKIYNKVLVNLNQPILKYEEMVKAGFGSGIVLKEQNQSQQQVAKNDEEEQEESQSESEESKEQDQSEEKQEKTPVFNQESEDIIQEQQQQQQQQKQEQTEENELIEENDFDYVLQTISYEQSNQRKMYERKASDSKYSEELEFHQFRKKKIQSLDKKSRHLLLFSNINQLNFVDVNKSEFVKAWAVLLHFKSKTTDSIIYDEFETIAVRNIIGKSKGHEQFGIFYLKLLEQSYQRKFKVLISGKCENTGWPIDLLLTPSRINYKFDPKQSIALFFFLQEELCQNVSNGQEYPLGVQKIMLKHLKILGKYKIKYISENQFYAQKGDIDLLVQSYLDKDFPDINKLAFSL